MTYQEAIDELRYQEDMRSKNINYQVNNIVISMAIKALEKQIEGEKNMEIKNARITDTRLGREDHGIFTFMIYVEFSGCACGIGGYALDEYDKETKERVFSAKSLEAVSKILEIVGVDNWEDLKGKYIRVKENGWGSTIDEIGNLMEEKWFNLREFFSQAEK